MAPVIVAEGLSKRYRLAGRPSNSLRDALTLGLGRWFGGRGSPPEELWALRDVGFELSAGDRLGIIGRNGAGKSTLLKILARVTEPTAGRVTLHGRLASLLEVGTGFHAELTGRENVYLNGAILGMTRAEVRRRFDEIVAFAGVERFLDVPVKRYSSGMHMRLAFAVAAHLDAEILVIDEVLAVGDVEFQRRCIERTAHLAAEGRTVLFVSHNLAAVSRLCTRAILLEQGRIAAAGAVDEVIRASARTETPTHDLAAIVKRSGDGSMRFAALSLEDADGRALARAATGQAVAIRVRLVNTRAEDARGLQVAIGIDSAYGARVVHLGSEPAVGSLPPFPPGEHVVVFRVPHLPLMPGTYQLSLFASLGGVVADWIQQAVRVEVDAGDFYGTGKLIPPSQGDVLVEHRVELEAGGRA